MSTVYQSYTQAASSYSPGTGASTLSPSYPSNQSGDVMIAFINVGDQDALASPNVTAPAGWSLAIDNGSFGINIRSAAYKKLGDGSTGTMVWSFDCPIRGNIDVLCYREVDTGTPLDATAIFHNDVSLGSSHTCGPITTVTANAMLVGAWFSRDTGISFNDSPELTNTRVSLAGTTGSPERPTLIADAAQAVAGASGTKTAATNSNSFCQSILVAIRPAPNPSVPLVTYPNGGESLTVGASVTLTCSAATSPTVAPSSLQYDFDYSTNNGGSWTNIGLSSAGVTSKAWTVPNAPGSTNLIRVRAYDGSLYSLAYDQSDAAFTIAAETTPGAPTINSPSAGSVQSKSAALAVAWTHQGGAGNPQTEFTLQWSRDAFASHTATVGPTTTATQSTTIDVSAEADGATISVKVKTKGVSLYSAYSSVRSFIIASAPATPNITAPTAGSPPIIPLPTVTFTEASTFVARKFRVVKAGVEVYNSGEVASSGLSFTSPYSFANGIAVTIYLSVKNTYGVWSAEDSETVTPAYTGPAVPTAVYTAVAASGYIQVQVTNSDTPSYNEIWRRVSGEDKSAAIRITPSLPKNASYSDYSVTSGVAYVYFVRAYNSTGLFTDSADS